MTEKTETARPNQSPSRWRKLLTSLKAFDQAMSYDPHEHRDAIVRHLWQRVEQLEARVNELDARNQPKAASAVTDAVGQT